MNDNMIKRLRALDGTDREQGDVFFGKVAEKIEAAKVACHEAWTDAQAEVSSDHQVAAIDTIHTDTLRLIQATAGG